jgi:hypothetical protein
MTCRVHDGFWTSCGLFLGIGGQECTDCTRVAAHNVGHGCQWSVLWRNSSVPRGAKSGSRAVGQNRVVGNQQLGNGAVG